MLHALKKLTRIPMNNLKKKTQKKKLKTLKNKKIKNKRKRGVAEPLHDRYGGGQTLIIVFFFFFFFFILGYHLQEPWGWFGHC
jgi:hypothetical protein